MSGFPFFFFLSVFTGGSRTRERQKKIFRKEWRFSCRNISLNQVTLHTVQSYGIKQQFFKIGKIKTPYIPPFFVVALGALWQNPNQQGVASPACLADMSRMVYGYTEVIVVAAQMQKFRLGTGCRNCLVMNQIWYY